jgi:hypothetical protein
MKDQCVIYYGQIRMVSPPSISEVQQSEEEPARAGPPDSSATEPADIRYTRMGNVTSRSRVLIWNRCSRGKLVHLPVGMIADK